MGWKPMPRLDPYHAASFDAEFASGKEVHGLGIGFVLFGQNAGGETLLGVVVEDRHGPLENDGTPVHILIHEMHGAAGDFHAVLEGVPLAMDPGDASRKIEGVSTKEPAFNLPAIWIPKDREEDAKFAGYTVVDNPTVIATHLTETIRNNAWDLLGRQEVQHLLDNLAKTSPKAVEELVPGLLSLGNVQKVLQNLLRERISVRDLLTVVETMADYAALSKDPDLLTEYVRQKLARSILSPFVEEDGILHVIAVDKPVEDLFTKSIQHTEHGAYLAMEPGALETISASVKEEAEKVIVMNQQPIILCSPTIRRHLRKIVEQVDATIMVVSHAEIMQHIRIQAKGKVSLGHVG